MEWTGAGVDEKGVVAALNPQKVYEKQSDFSRLERLKVGVPVISIDPRYFRPTEVESLLGDASKSKNILEWEPQISFQEMVHDVFQPFA